MPFGSGILGVINNGISTLGSTITGVISGVGNITSGALNSTGVNSLANNPALPGAIGALTGNPVAGMGGNLGGIMGILGGSQTAQPNQQGQPLWDTNTTNNKDTEAAKSAIRTLGIIIVGAILAVVAFVAFKSEGGK